MLIITSNCVITAAKLNKWLVNASVYIHSGPLVHQVLVYAPGENVSEAFAHDTGSEPSEVAYCAVVLVYFEDSLPYALVVLGLIFIIVLEEYACSYDVEGVRDHATHEIGGDTGQRGDQRCVHHALLVRVSYLVQQQQRVELLAELVDREEDA